MLFSIVWQAKHAAGGNINWGINGDTGDMADMKDVGVWEPVRVKSQVIKTAVEVCGFV